MSIYGIGMPPSGNQYYPPPPGGMWGGPPAPPDGQRSEVYYPSQDPNLMGTRKIQKNT